MDIYFFTLVVLRLPDPTSGLMPASLGQPPKELELRGAISVISEAPDGKYLQEVQLKS